MIQLTDQSPLWTVGLVYKNTSNVIQLTEVYKPTLLQ